MPVTKEQFLQVYANLPLGVRKEIILVIDSQPITWNVANLEVSENTKLGKQILIKLEKLGIIKGD
jgi:hypothetical protein